MEILPKNKLKRWLLTALVVLLGAGGAVMAPACATVGTSPSGDAMDVLKRSPNYKEEQFVNGIRAEEPPFFKTLVEWVKGADHTVPDQAVPVVPRKKIDFSQLPATGLRITWVGHSTTLVEIDGTRLLLDPIWSERSSPFPWMGPKRFHRPPFAMEDLPEIDAVLISHDHYDHLDKSTVLHLGKKGLRFVVPLGVGSKLQGWNIPREQIQELDWWDGITVNGVTITATPARHFSGRSAVMTDRNKNLWAGFAMAGENHRVYYTGDTGMFPGFKEIGQRLGPFDATLIEVGAYNQLWSDLHLGPEQAVQAVKQARGGLMVPVHWGTFDLALHSWTEPAERLLVAAAKNSVSLAIPKPGQSVEPATPLAFERWWPEVPWQSEQEHPVVASGLPVEQH